MKRMFLVVTLLIVFVGSSFAQANLYDKIIEKAYNLSVEAVEAGKNRMSAYEECLEKQELEAAKKAEEEALEAKKAEESNFEENCELLKASAIDYSMEHKAWIKCYYYPFEDYIWYILFVGDDGDLWINLRYDDSGELGDLFYSTKNERLDYTKAIDDTSGKVSASIKLTGINNKYIIFMQDFYDPNDFTMTYIE